MKLIFQKKLFQQKKNRKGLKITKQNPTYTS